MDKLENTLGRKCLTGKAEVNMRSRAGCGLVLLSFLVLVTSIGRSTCVPPPPGRRGVLDLAVGGEDLLGPTPNLRLALQIHLPV